MTSVALGVASFAGCSISGPVGAYTLSATDTNDGLVVATSSTITLSPGTPTHLAFVQGPTNATAGSAISPAVTVAVEDAAGNVETGDHTTTVGVSIGTNPGGGTLTGGFCRHGCRRRRHLLGALHQQDRHGLHADGKQHAELHRGDLVGLQHHAGGSQPPGLRPGTDDHRCRGHHDPGRHRRRGGHQRQHRDGRQRHDGDPGHRDEPGRRDAQRRRRSNGVAGVATFPSLSINKTGTGYTLTANSTPAYTAATSSAFNITPGTPTKLAFIQNPTNTAAGSAITPAVTVAVEDANGNVETGDNATKVTLAIGTNPGGGTLTGGSAVTVAAGVATFSGLSINKTGTGYTLSASSTPTYTAATSSRLQHHPRHGHQAGLHPEPDQHRRRFPYQLRR